MDDLPGLLAWETVLCLSTYGQSSRILTSKDSSDAQWEVAASPHKLILDYKPDSAHANKVRRIRMYSR